MTKAYITICYDCGEELKDFYDEFHIPFLPNKIYDTQGKETEKLICKECYLKYYNLTHKK